MHHKEKRQAIIKLNIIVKKYPKKRTMKSYLLRQKAFKKVMWKGMLKIMKKEWRPQVKTSQNNL
jgi:hypothetical protein